MYGVKTSAVHAFEHDEMSAGVRNRDRNRDAGFACLKDGGCNHVPRTIVGQALGVGNIHGGGSIVVGNFRYDSRRPRRPCIVSSICVGTSARERKMAVRGSTAAWRATYGP